MRPAFKELDFIKVKAKMERLTTIKRVINTKKSFICVICRKSTEALTFAAGLKLALCGSCEVFATSQLTPLFETPYGSSLTQAFFENFCQRTARSKDRLIVEQAELFDQLEVLVEKHNRLIRWQGAFDDHSFNADPERYQKGILDQIPPRRLEEIVVFRSDRTLTDLDPTDGLPDGIRRRILSFFNSEEQEEVPF